jgi:hypothetical protein
MSSSPTTTASIALDSQAEAEAERDPEIARALKADIDYQLRLENEILNNLDSCPVSTDRILDHLSNLNAGALGEQTRKHFYNPEVVKAAVCISSTITIPKVNSQYASNERVRNWITDLRQIGAESVEGYALTADLAIGQPQTQPARNFYVVKAPRNPNNATELLHETFVALTTLNGFRADGIPNFACVYAYSKCSTPFIDSATKEVTTWCNSLNESVTYSLYENISDNLGSMGDFCESCDAQSFMQYFMQSCYAIRYGYYKCGWTHYDYHADNAMIRKYSNKPFYIRYPCRNKEGGSGWIWLLSPGGITTVIDYGMSHIELEVQGKRTHFGHCGHSAPLREYGIYRDRAHPMHDVYKHLCMCLAEMARKGNTVCYTKIIPLLKYFNTAEDPSKIIVDQSATYYYLPLNEDTLKLNIDDWIDWVQNNYDCRSFIRTELPIDNSQVLGCGSECFSLTQVLEVSGIKLTVFPSPTTFLELYDIVSHHIALYKMSATQSDREYHAAYVREIITRFPFDLVVVYETKRIGVLFKKLYQPFNYFSLPIYTQDWFNDSVLTQTKTYIANATRFFDAYQRIQLALDVVDFFIVDQKGIKSNVKDTFARFRIDLNRCAPWKKTLTTHLLKQYYLLFPSQRNPPAPSQQIKEIANLERKTINDEMYTKFKWYWITFSSLTVLLK